MALAIIGGISAATGIAQGIFGASQASKQNAQARAAAKEQKKQQKEIAKKTNQYNKKAFVVEQENYWNQYNYQWDTAVQSWQRGNEIQDFKYLQDLRLYAKSLQIRDDQLNFNDLAGKQAYAAEDAALTGLFRQQMFDREAQVDSLKKTLLEGELNRKATQVEFNAAVGKDMLGKLTINEAMNQYTKEASFKKESALIDNIKAQGQTAMRQASRGKGQQATMGEFYRNLSQIESSLTGRQRQAALQLMELGVQTETTKSQLGLQRSRIDAAMLDSVRDMQFNMRVLDADIASAVEQSIRNRGDIALRQYGADLNTIANTMIRPERLSYDPTPVKPPARVFIEPMEVLPGAVAAPMQQSVFAPLVAGIGSAASSLAQINWKAPGGNTTRGYSFPSSVSNNFNQALSMNPLI
jgi:hypothetical protein